MADLLGTCRWCRRPIAWDHDMGLWRHTESKSLTCHNGSWAAIDLDTANINGTTHINATTRDHTNQPPTNGAGR